MFGLKKTDILESKPTALSEHRCQTLEPAQKSTTTTTKINVIPLHLFSFYRVCIFSALQIIMSYFTLFYSLKKYINVCQLLRVETVTFELKVTWLCLRKCWF